jgi:cytochrome c oxidase assembly protein subunit 15
VFGAFTRLTDSGLGCPDWPGCYGEANPFLAHEHIAAAEALMPTGPVTKVKAWIEMIHRFLAMGIGFLIIGLMVASWLEWRRTRPRCRAGAADRAVPLGVRAGRVRRLDRDDEAAAGHRDDLHLLLGMTLLALAVWLGGREDRLLARRRPPPACRLRRLRLLALAGRRSCWSRWPWAGG